MTDKPILFSGPMVRAILEGRKTMTRRALKLRGYKTFSELQPCDYSAHHWTFRRADKAWCDYTNDDILKLLPIQVGDRLWVRETFATDGPLVRYAATDDIHEMRKKKSSIFMPRWASRITLEVTGVKVERLQDISEEDAKAEGAREDNEGCDHARRTCEKAGCIGSQWRGYRGGFANIWFDINGAESWHANPWVAAYSFKRLP